MLVLLVAAAGCYGQTPKTPPMPGTVAPNREDRAMVLVQASPAGRAFGFFPSHPGAEPCVIQGGGAAPGRHIHGLCLTQAIVRGTAARVVFTERWPWRAFHYAGSPRRPQHHSWRFSFPASGKVTAAGDIGDLPPQLAR